MLGSVDYDRSATKVYHCSAQYAVNVAYMYSASAKCDWLR